MSATPINTKKTVIAIWHKANNGKTDTLRAFANLLLTTYPTHSLIFSKPTPIPATADFQLVVQINGKIIGIESQGDPNTGLNNKLINLTSHHHCDIILCSTRTSGDTVKAVDYLCSQYGFDAIWTSTYQVTSNHRFANQTKAEHILDLLKKLNLI